MPRPVTAMMRLDQILLRFELVSDVSGLRRGLTEFVRDSADRDATDIARNMLRHVEDGRWGYFVHNRRVVSDIAKL